MKFFTAISNSIQQAANRFYVAQRTFCLRYLPEKANYALFVAQYNHQQCMNQLDSYPPSIVLQVAKRFQ